MTAAIDVVRTSDVVVVGTGVAGLTAALAARGLEVALITKTRLGHGGASPMAQGGVAAAVAPGDSPADHAADTVRAAAGLADEEIVHLLTGEGPDRMADLVALGTRFDRRADGRLALGREAAHRRARVLHAGDATGAEIVRALVAAVRESSRLAVYENTECVDLVLERGRVGGVTALDPEGARVCHLAPAVVLATGGTGQVYSHTTNPVEATGGGLAMAARAGARLADLEFVQFHPTALAVGADPMPLLTEALRGRGATLVNARGYRFMPDFHPAAELAPRDVVARVIWQLEREGVEVFLDTRAAVGHRLAEEFPTAWSHCLEHGLDPGAAPLPVSPAAHYHMGGVAVDANGRSSLEGLWACGEVGRTGAHGANRLASNSLLEALVFGRRVGLDLATTAPLPPIQAPPGRLGIEIPSFAAAKESRQVRAEVRRTMWAEVGLARNHRGLSRAARHFERLAKPTGLALETRNLLTVAGLITRAALARTESRGAHYRVDFPAVHEAWRGAAVS